MKTNALLLLCLSLSAAEPIQKAQPFREALPGYAFSFPRDHFNHPDFQTEWWYFTGNLTDPSGRPFGFELTFFRRAADRSSQGLWNLQDVWLAHLALTDVHNRSFLHDSRLQRSGPGLAGADLSRRLVWNGNWSARFTSDNALRLEAVAPRFRLALDLDSRKPPVIHGENGVSQKAPEPGRASHYLSLTRLETRGALTLDGQRFSVTGLSWMDHEFFTHQLSPDQQGWDWFSLQFDDGSELMAYRLRRKDGSVDPFSSGTFIDAQGRARHLSRQDFRLTPGRQWQVYPVEWRIEVPSLGLDLQIRPLVDAQELSTRPPAYWEGAIEAQGSRRGRGYLEMTGYRGAVGL